jgi:secreted trypsin-like serine protease
LLPVVLAATMVKEQLSEGYLVAAGLADDCQKDLDLPIYLDSQEQSHQN